MYNVLLIMGQHKNFCSIAIIIQSEWKFPVNLSEVGCRLVWNLQWINLQYMLQVLKMTPMGIQTSFYLFILLATTSSCSLGLVRGFIPEITNIVRIVFMDYTLHSNAQLVFMSCTFHSNPQIKMRGSNWVKLVFKCPWKLVFHWICHAEVPWIHEPCALSFWR